MEFRQIKLKTSSGFIFVRLEQLRDPKPLWSVSTWKPRYVRGDFNSQSEPGLVENESEHKTRKEAVAAYEKLVEKYSIEKETEIFKTTISKGRRNESVKI